MMGRCPQEDVPDELPIDVPDALLTRIEASEYLRGLGLSLKPQTLAAIASRAGDGPPTLKRGRFVLYPKRSLHLWGVIRLTGFRRGTSGALR